MKIAVLVEPMNGNGFRATGGEPFCIATEGATPAEALDKFKSEAEARLKAGGEVVTVEIGSQEHPLLKFAGMFKDDPLLEEWKQAMEDHRNQVEKDDARP